jgi:hypothetical protein
MSLLEHKVPPLMFNIKLLKPEYIEVKKFILRINGAWMDIHRLNYIAKYLVLQLTEDKRRKVDIFSNMGVMAKDFYIHFSIVFILLREISKKLKGNRDCSQFIVTYNNFYKNLGEKIQKIRNPLLTHMEKPDYMNHIGYVQNTSCGGLFLSIATEKDGVFQLKPFMDAKELENYLVKIKEVIEA